VRDGDVRDWNKAFSDDISISSNDCSARLRLAHQARTWQDAQLTDQTTLQARRRSDASTVGLLEASGVHSAANESPSSSSSFERQRRLVP
jgi:hypothetical protein